MNVLIHTCCAPCLLYPTQILQEQNVGFTCYFYNPNIHPYREFRSRLNSFIDLAEQRNFKVIIDRDYGIGQYLRSVAFRESQRCRVCYETRLKRTAQLARDNNFTHFTTTLMFSIHQNHDLIQFTGHHYAKREGVSFYYQDFRDGWEQAGKEATELNLYQQKYCGCIFSEQERYDNRLKKRLKKKRDNHV